MRRTPALACLTLSDASARSSAGNDRRHPAWRYHRKATLITRRLLGAACLSLMAASAAGQAIALEYGVKAAYLLNFTRFVEWPRTALEGTDPFTVCVAGANPFGPVLARTLAGEIVAGRTVVSRVVTDAAGARCHVLFIPRTVAAAPFLRAVRGTPVLTVGEAEGFLEQGGAINFVLEEGKVRFEVNPDAVSRNQLTMSSRLLRLARNRTPDGIG
jgi:hypothetical protein